MYIRQKLGFTEGEYLTTKVKGLQKVIDEYYIPTELPPRDVLTELMGWDFPSKKCLLAGAAITLTAYFLFFS